MLDTHNYRCIWAFFLKFLVNCYLLCCMDQVFMSYEYSQECTKITRIENPNRIGPEFIGSVQDRTDIGLVLGSNIHKFRIGLCISKYSSKIQKMQSRVDDRQGSHLIGCPIVHRPHHNYYFRVLFTKFTTNRPTRLAVMKCKSCWLVQLQSILKFEHK